MAQPKLIKKNNQWYRILNGKETKLSPGYKLYNSASGHWVELREDNKFHNLKIGERNNGQTPNRKQLTEQYMKYDLAPKLYPKLRSNRARLQNNKYYKEITDSIMKRIGSGFYEEYPEQYKRDLKMRDQYDTDYESDYTCINSASSVSGTSIPGNYTFKEKTPKRFSKPITINPSSLTNEISKGLSEGSIIQVVNNDGVPYHSVAYYGEDPENSDSIIIYDTHGQSTPFKNGSQLRTIPKDYYKGYKSLNIYRLK